MRCHRNSLVSVLAAAGVKCSVPCHCGPGAALLRCNTVYAVPTIDDRLASEGNRGPDLNSRRTISHSRFDGFVPIVEQSCWCQTTAAGNSWRRCLKLNGSTQISDVRIRSPAVASFGAFRRNWRNRRCDGRHWLYKKFIRNGWPRERSRQAAQFSRSPELRKTCCSNTRPTAITIRKPSAALAWTRCPRLLSEEIVLESESDEQP